MVAGAADAAVGAEGAAGAIEGVRGGQTPSEGAPDEWRLLSGREPHFNDRDPIGQ